jgi:hypothetical protein
LVLNGEEESELSKRLDTCTEVIKTLVQSAVENVICPREGIDGREVGNELRPLGGVIAWQAVVFVEDYFPSDERYNVKY